MTFKKYPKIHRLGKEEVEGILDGICHVEEKLDGANASIWVDKRGEITCGSRNRELTEGFNGFVDFVKTDPAINKLMAEHPDWRLYGEWLVRHTIQYNETVYRKFYLYDITVVKDGEEPEEFFTREKVRAIGDEYGIPMPQHFGSFENPTEDQLKAYLGVTNLGEKGEGIVIKNETFRDKFGSHNYAKMVTEEFKENNAVTFGGNNKHSDTYWEMYIVNKYMTLARVQKIMHKIQPLIEERLDLKHIPRVANTAYHDLITEEAWEIAQNVQMVNFQALKRCATKKAIQIYKDVLSGSISVADNVTENE